MLFALRSRCLILRCWGDLTGRLGDAAQERAVDVDVDVVIAILVSAMGSPVHIHIVRTGVVAAIVGMLTSRRAVQKELTARVVAPNAQAAHQDLGQIIAQ